MNSKRKGKEGELEMARYMRARGYDAHRGQQYRGGEDSPDVVGVPYLHLEVKRRARFELYPFLEQARRDSGENIPVVVYRADRAEWTANLYLDDFMKIYRIYELYADKEGER